MSPEHKHFCTQVVLVEDMHAKVFTAETKGPGFFSKPDRVNWICGFRVKDL